ncbi:TetR family transcriptional regulator [Bradyrhizobium sp. CB3481]|uniref:TetR/AcrR family transcriptional regulator n=1 Tax=Bradyrhizobium sp. CB3481 TaxID=3039158 RepID=UPI0024B1AB18|nr:TetR family transcriptional regulator [Bradyrhizobium sp. CB3481]WFU15944.1 TetR family transcriptional regulator [Bradyrhizobium sp. CB3481]
MANAIDDKPSPRERPLMEATLRIIGRKGIDGVTHRAVAAETGMSVGAVTHHFMTRDSLVNGALRFALTREVERLRAFAFSLQNKAFDLDAWVDALTGWYSQELKIQPEVHIACYEAFLAAARSERHRPVVAEWFATWRQSAELALRAAGSSEPQLHATLFVSALNGILLQQLAIPRRGFRQEATKALSKLVRQLIARE